MICGAASAAVVTPGVLGSTTRPSSRVEAGLACPAVPATQWAGQERNSASSSACASVVETTVILCSAAQRFSRVTAATMRSAPGT